MGVGRASLLGFNCHQLDECRGNLTYLLRQRINPLVSITNTSMAMRPSQCKALLHCAE